MLDNQLFVYGISVQTQAASKFDQLGWHNIGWNLQDWMFSLVVPLVLLLVVSGAGIFISRWYTKAKNEQRKLLEQSTRLKNMLQKCRITPEENSCIEKLSALTDNNDMIAVVENPDIFEQCVDKMLNNTTGQSAETIDLTASLISTIRQKIGFNVYSIDRPLFSTRAIPTGQVCSIFGGASNKEPLVKNAVVITNNERSMKLKLPNNDIASVKEHLETTLRIAFSRPNDGYYGAEVAVIGTPRSGFIETGHTIQIKRSQLRKFVRLGATIPVKVRMIKPSYGIQPSLPPGQPIETNMIDISGGGISFTYAKPLNPGDLVSLNFSLGSTKISGLQAQVLRITEKIANEQKKFYHHVTFKQVEPTLQEKIVRFIFEQMRILSTMDVKRK